MKFRQSILLVVLTIGFVTFSYSQHRTVPIKNGFAIGGGITNYDVIYGMQLSQSTLEIAGRTNQEVIEGNNVLEPPKANLKYKLFSAQLGLLGHAKLFDGHFTIDAGPMLQYIGKMELEDSAQEGYLINGYDALTADAITDISSVQLNGAIGATVGFGPVKLRAQYIYGITNMFNRLNDQDLNTTGGESEFKGNQSMLAFMALFTF